MSEKILFTDLDGTLLDNHQNISEGNRAALNRALSEGHRIVVTTGRALPSGLNQCRRLSLDGPGCYLIAYNGGVIYDCSTGESIFERAIPKEAAVEIIRMCRRLDVHAQTYDEEAVLVEEDCDNETVRSYAGRTNMIYKVVDSFERDLKNAPPKVLAIAPRAKLEILYDELAEFEDVIDRYYSTETLLEIVPKGVAKGVAVEWMCERMGVPIENSIAAGDEQNDLSMIVAAGVGAAMANAIPSLKEAADYVTENDNEHDGIAEIIEKFMLQN